MKYLTLPSHSVSREEIYIKADNALKRSRGGAGVADEFLQYAHGVLLFPELIRVGK